MVNEIGKSSEEFTTSGIPKPAVEIPLAKTPERNIIFVGEGEPATEFHGAFKVKLPDAETQRKGFYHEKAVAIIQHHPKLYKKFVRKGDK